MGRAALAFWFRRVLALGGGLIIGWALGFLVFVANLPTKVADPDQGTDAIVVLTGGSERLATGLTLLAQGKAPLLFISGVHRGVDLADLMRQVPHPPHPPASQIHLGHAADDTVGNAAETAHWIEAHKITSIRLVTGAYHMPRARLEMAHALPGITILAHPVFPETVKNREWWRWPGTAGLLATEYSKYLAVTVRHLLLPRRP